MPGPAPFRKRPPMGHLRAGHARPLLSLQWEKALYRVKQNGKHGCGFF